MIYKKLEVFNNYKITNIILYKMFTICLRFVKHFSDGVWYNERSGEGKKSNPSDRSLTIYSKGLKGEHMNI